MFSHMDLRGTKHKNYELLNLIGYGLSKFGDKFLAEFGFTKKVAFYQFCVDLGVAETGSTVKNRMDLFDPFFPESGRSGWWQRKDDYVHRKIYIDSQFGDLPVQDFASLVKLLLTGDGRSAADALHVQPIARSRFKQMQETGRQAERFFEDNYARIVDFRLGTLVDARLEGDGYDYQINLAHSWHLVEVKGIRESQGSFRMTEKEYSAAQEYGTDYSVVAVLNLNEGPQFHRFVDPVRTLRFEPKIISSRESKEYHSGVVGL